MSQTFKAVQRWGTWHVFFPYTPMEIKSWDDIPDRVVEKLHSYLKKRLGQLSAKLNLAGGYIIDPLELAQLRPSAPNRVVPTYVVALSFSMPEFGLEMYRSTVELDAEGEVVKDIDVPNLEANPEKCIAVSLEAAADKAERLGFSGNSVAFVYSPDTDNWYWRFGEGDRPKTSPSSLTIYNIDAGTGEAKTVNVGYQTI